MSCGAAVLATGPGFALLGALAMLALLHPSRRRLQRDSALLRDSYEPARRGLAAARDQALSLLSAPRLTGARLVRALGRAMRTDWRTALAARKHKSRGW